MALALLTVSLLCMNTYGEKKPRIGIVGGGASGLYLAHELLYDYGLTDITIFEKGSTASASAVSYKVDDLTGYAVDLGTIFIPSSSYKILNDDYEIDFEIWEPLKFLINKYGLDDKLEPLSASFIFDATTKEISSFGKAFIYAGYDITDPAVVQKFIAELITVMNILEPLYELDLYDIKDIYDLGIAQRGETMLEWGERLDLEIVTYLQLWAADAAGLAPAVNSSAACVLKLTQIYRMSYFVSLLNMFGINSDSEIIQHYPFIRALLDNNGDPDGVPSKPTYYRFKTGYQSLWDNMVQDLKMNSNNKINILFNTTVISVNNYLQRYFYKRRSKKICIKTVSTNNNLDEEQNEYIFDYVFISCRRDCVLDILDVDAFPTRYNLYKNYASETIDYYAALYYIGRNKQQWISTDGIYPIAPWSVYSGTHDIDITYSCEPFYGYVVDNANYFVPFGYIGPDIDSLNKCINNSYSLIIDDDPSSFGLGIKNITTSDIIMNKRWDMGSQILPIGESNYMYEQVYDLQGHNGLFFIGETLAGFSVPNQIEFILKHKNEWIDTMGILEYGNLY